ncbi:hypothetical protein LXL04_018407 [Taraxacum kok-saghyz]
MPEARDRLARPNSGVAEIYRLRRSSVDSIGILPDDGDSEISVNRTPFRWGATPLTGDASGQPMAVAPSTRTIAGATARVGGAGRGLFGTPRTVYRRGGRSQNTPPSGSTVRRARGRSGSQSVLPSWYPRTPLGDITHVVRAIERRRAHLVGGEGQVLGSPTPIRIDHPHTVHDPSPSGAHLEHELSLVTPNPKLASKSFRPPQLKIFADVQNQADGESDFLTPQKKLLNSIDIVEKVVMEELHRLKRTPTAKKAEREKRVRTLMSMR